MPQSGACERPSSKRDSACPEIDLRAEAFAGATVVHGVAGCGANSVIHTASLIELSADLPVVIEVVDDQAHVDRLIPILDDMITGGALVTVERVRVLRYAASSTGSSGAD